MMRLLRQSLAVHGTVVLLLLFATTASAQPAVATLAGQVLDPQGAPVPGAVVTVERRSTTAAWMAVTSDDGQFSLALLPPGTYQVRVELRGFATWQADDLILQVGQRLRLDVRLSVSALRETVSVVAAVRPASAAVEGVLSAAAIESLPLNGRNFLELSLLVPGNSPTPTFDPTKTNSVLISSAGQLGRGGNVTIDGQDNNDDVVGGPLLNLPIDAVEEFQIATNRFGAELGRSASSAINVVTRSGTNTLRGAASIYARDGAWQARSATIDDDATEPPFDRQQLSGAVGGPLVRDRIFWFAATELRHQDGGVQVGERDTAARTIRYGFAEAPLRDRLWSLRLDAGTGANRFTARYAGEHATDTSSSAGERAIGSPTQRQDATNRYNAVLGTWSATPTSRIVNALSGSVSTFLNVTNPAATMPQLTFPSLVDGASFRMPQETRQTRLQVANTTALAAGPHSVRFGGELQRVDAAFLLGVFQQGRVELVQDFPGFDHTGDGRIDDNDLLFAVTLRSGKPEQALNLPDSDNTHVAMFLQDDWSVSNRLQLNIGLRYELDTEVNNQSRADELNPIVLPFVTGERQRDLNNFSPRVGFVWSLDEGGRRVVRGGYGVYYDRVVLQIQSLERGLDGRALPIEVRAGNTFFLDPATGRLPPFAPTLANPFSGFVLPGAGASGINIIDPHLQNPTVQEFHLGFGTSFGPTTVRVDGLHNHGTRFLIGRTVGEVFNPVVGGPDRVVNIESSARTQYDALLASVDRKWGADHELRAGYTLAKAFNYANDDQIPFLNGPIDPNDLRREWGPTPNDRRHRLVLSGRTRLKGGVVASGIWTMSSAVPMDIMMPDGQTRVPVLQRNAGGRQFHDASELNAFITRLNAGGGVDGELLPLVPDDARFGDAFSSVDVRITRPFRLGSRARVEPMLEVFNLFNTTNILGVSNVNYSGYSSVLVRDSDVPGSPGYLRSSTFGQPVSTAGGVFGSGGARALQLAARITF